MTPSTGVRFKSAMKSLERDTLFMLEKNIIIASSLCILVLIL